jgi:hypothetical protein
MDQLTSNTNVNVGAGLVPAPTFAFLLPLNRLFYSGNKLYQSSVVKL